MTDFEFNPEKYAGHTEELIFKCRVIQNIIANMCAEGRTLKMTIPANKDDDDIYITETLKQLIEFLTDAPDILAHCVKLEEQKAELVEALVEANDAMVGLIIDDGNQLDLRDVVKLRKKITDLINKAKGE